jgi:hypothetical protein
LGFRNVYKELVPLYADSTQSRQEDCANRHRDAGISFLLAETSPLEISRTCRATMSPRSPPTSATETTDTVSVLAQEKTAVVAPIIDDKDAARLRREKDAATASWIESALQRRLQRGKIESLPSVKPKGCLGGCYLDIRRGSQQLYDSHRFKDYTRTNNIAPAGPPVWLWPFGRK